MFKSAGQNSNLDLNLNVNLKVKPLYKFTDHISILKYLVELGNRYMLC
jgi:hypothetical protein